MRTNEELALAIQSGDVSLYDTLWKQIERLIHTKCLKWYTRSQERFTRLGVDYDDLVQECYFAMVEAVEAFDPESGLKFTSYLNFPIKKRLNAISNNRTSRQKNDPTLSCTSLDIEVGAEGDCPLGELIPDETARIPFEAIEQQDWNRALQEAIETVLDTLTENQQEVIRLRFYEDKSLIEISEETGRSRERIRQIQEQSLKAMKKPLPRKILKPFYDEIKIPVHSSYDLHKSTEQNAINLMKRKRRTLDELKKVKDNLIRHAAF